MTFLRIKDLTQTELEQLLKNRIKELRELEMKIEEMYRIGYHDGADHLEMISDVIIEDIIEIENLLEQKNKKVTQTTWHCPTVII